MKFKMLFKEYKKWFVDNFKRRYGTVWNAKTDSYSVGEILADAGLNDVEISDAKEALQSEFLKGGSNAK